MFSRSSPLLIEPGCEIKRPGLVVLSGASGSGKGTIKTRVLQISAEQDPTPLVESRSWTTRERRPNESPTAYVFTTREDFEEALRNNNFLEWTEFNGNYYGTPRPNEIDRLLAEIEVNGADDIRLQAVGAGTLHLIQFQYLLAANPAQLERQLFGRSDNMTNDQKQERIRIFYKVEYEKARKLGAHVIINRDPEIAAAVSAAAANGVYLCDPQLSEIVALYDEERQRVLESI